jgi:hypothetical protein
MIKPLILSILILISISYQENTPKAPEYISFIRADENQNHSKKIYISTAKLNIQLDSLEYNILKRNLKTINKPITKEVYQAFVNMYYVCVVTDRKNYQALFDFINNHSELYDTKGIKDYDIYNEVVLHINNKSFFLINKNSITFFEKLKEYLRSKHCDSAVIKALEEI